MINRFNGYVEFEFADGTDGTGPMGPERAAGDRANTVDTHMTVQGSRVAIFGLQVSVRWLMAAIGTIAITISLFFGVAYLVAYVSYAEGERTSRERAVAWESKSEPERARFERQKADESTRMKQAYLACGMSTLVLIGAGIIMGLTVAVIRARYGLASSDRPRRVHNVAVVCATGARVVFASLILAVIAYAGLMALILSDD